jgi:hypothetical protein
MYYIYHIPGVKIGCSIQPKIRVKAQGYTEYEILEEHNNKKIASYREVELQKKYGYVIDNCKYDQNDYSAMGKKGGPRGGKKTRDSGKLLENAKLSWNKERSEKQLETFKKAQIIGQEISAKLPRSEKQLETFKKAQKIGSPIGAKIGGEVVKEKYGIKLQVNLKLDNSFVGVYDSIAECARLLCICTRDISHCLNPNRKQYSTHGYTFKKIEKI